MENPTPQLRKYNRYQDVEIDAAMLPHDEIGEFISALFCEEAQWLRRLDQRVAAAKMRNRALFWVKVSVRLSHLLPVMLGTEIFKVHHATPEYIMLVKSPGGLTSMTNVPLYGTHYARVECVVMDCDGEDRRKYLVVSEMIGSTPCDKKLVTGSVESGEYVSAAAEREVMEETGIKAKFVGILGVVNRLCTRFGRDELLVGCLLRADPPGLQQTPRAMSAEIVSAEWADEIDNRWRCGASAAEVPDIRGHGHTMMKYQCPNFKF
jgi:hypothetical protein